MRRRWWFLAAVAAWGVVLLVLAFTAHGRPTVLQQQSPAGARPTVDRGIAAVLSAAGDHVAAAIGGYRQVRRCDLTADRGGVEYARTLDLYGPATRGPAVLAGLTRRLPAGFKAQRVPALQGSQPVTVAHPDPFVKLTVRAVSGDPGHLRAVVDTGCRPTTGHPYPKFLAAPTNAERAPVARAFALFDATPSTWRRDSLPCGPGRTAVTVRADGTARESIGPLPRILDATPAPLPDTVLAHGDSRYVYAGDGTDLVVSATADRLTVISTTGCR